MRGMKVHTVVSKYLRGSYVQAALDRTTCPDDDLPESQGGYAPDPTRKRAPVWPLRPVYDIGSLVKVRYPNIQKGRYFASIVIDYNSTWTHSPYYIQYLKSKTYDYVVPGRISGVCQEGEKGVIGSSLVGILGNASSLVGSDELELTRNTTTSTDDGSGDNSTMAFPETKKQDKTTAGANEEVPHELFRMFMRTENDTDKEKTNTESKTVPKSEPKIEPGTEPITEPKTSMEVEKAKKVAKRPNLDFVDY